MDTLLSTGCPMRSGGGAVGRSRGMAEGIECLCIDRTTGQRRKSLQVLQRGQMSGQRRFLWVSRGWGMVWRGDHGGGRCRLRVPLALQRMGAVARHFIPIDHRRTGVFGAARSQCVPWSPGVASACAHVTALLDIDAPQFGEVVYCSEMVNGVLSVIGICRDMSRAKRPSNDDLLRCHFRVFPSGS